MACPGTITASGTTAAAPGGEFKASVLSVGDGDTLRVSTGSKPDGFEPPKRRRPPKASSPAPTCSTVCHRYGRTVAEVISDININLVMVEDGQAYPLHGDGEACESLRH